MKKTFGFTITIILIFVMSFSIMASQKKTNEIKGVPQIYRNDYFGLNIQLGSEWEAFLEDSYSYHQDGTIVITSLFDTVSEGFIQITLSDLKNYPNTTLDSFIKEFNNSYENTSKIQSTTINEIYFKTFDHLFDNGKKDTHYITNKGTKFYNFRFYGVNPNDIISILNTISISETQTQTIPKLEMSQDVSPIQSIKVLDQPESVSKPNNDLLYLYNNNVYINDKHKFYITLDNNWIKPTYDEAHYFSFGEDYLNEIEFNTVDNTLQNTLRLYLAIGEASENITLEISSSRIKENILELMPNSINFGPVRNTSLCGIPFKYITFDTFYDDGTTYKSYFYYGLKGNSGYAIIVSNITSTNKLLATKALKSIVIQ